LENSNLPPEQMPIFLGFSGGGIFRAVQNMIVACRTLGLGTVLTTVLGYREEEVRSILKPPDNRLCAALPIGYPIEGYGHGPSRRLPTSELSHVDTHGNNWPRKLI